MKRIQSLLGESQSIVNWDDKDVSDLNAGVPQNLLCIFNSYATLLRGGNDVQKTMKSKKKARIRSVMSRYIDRLRHSIDKINKRHALEASKKRKQEESAKEKSHQLKWFPDSPLSSRQSTTVSLTADPKPPTSKDPLFQPLTLPRHVSGLPKETMVIRLVPATDVLDSALRSCGYTPLLELTVRTTFTVRMLFAHLRTRWSKFCQRVQGVFRLTIAASSTTGVWVESRVSSKEPLVVSPHVVLSDTNSLLSNRMEKSAGAAEVVFLPLSPAGVREQRGQLHGAAARARRPRRPAEALDRVGLPAGPHASYCVVSHSRRIRTFFLSPLLPCRLDMSLPRSRNAGAARAARRSHADRRVSSRRLRRSRWRPPPATRTKSTERDAAAARDEETRGGGGVGKSGEFQAALRRC